jgi:hypothetical protein
MDFLLAYILNIKSVSEMYKPYKWLFKKPECRGGRPKGHDGMVHLTFSTTFVIHYILSSSPSLRSREGE